MKLQRYFRGQIKMIFSKYAMYMKKFGGVFYFFVLLKMQWNVETGQ